MPRFDGTLAEFFRERYGIASLTEVRSTGVSDDERQTLLSRGVLLELFEGVYQLASSPLTFHARCRAVCVADASLVLSCFTSGTLMNLRRCGNPWLHAMTQRLTKPVGPSVKVHRTRLDLSERTVQRPDGIRHTDPLQTWFDLAKHVDDLRLRSIGEQIIADGLATHEELATYAASIAARGRPGSPRALRVIGSRTAAGDGADSDGEVVLFEALQSAGFTEFVRHPAVVLRDGSTVHPDMGVPGIGFYVEVDHHTWHTQSADVEYDKLRDREVRLTGATVERVPTSQIEHQLASVVADLGLRLRQHKAQSRR